MKKSKKTTSQPRRSKGARDRTIYGLLRKDHVKVRLLLDKLVRASSRDDDTWRDLVEQIRDELIPHARAEEAVFYNSIRSLDPGNEEIRHSFAEHLMAESELRMLQSMKAIDVNWTALAKKLRQDILHHVREEEGKIFRIARGLISDEQAREIGRAFERMKPGVRRSSLLLTSAELLVNLMPPKKAA